MRAKVMVILALVAAPALAQLPGGAKGPPDPSQTTLPVEVKPSTTTITAEPEDAPVRSTLKPVAPAGDGSQPRQRLVTVFGTEPCPKPTSADEVVVCARLPESEVFRIPTPLRQAEKRDSPFEANRNLLLGDASGGAGGSIGSCTAVGAGGMMGGCTQRQVDAWAKDRAGRMGASEEVPRQ
jgi:hypothetical protein